MHSAIQIAASLLILVPFILAQAGRLTTSSFVYLVLNLVGSTVLGIDAFMGAQWGFLLLEAAWAIVSAISLVRLVVSGAGDSKPSSTAAAK